MLNHRIISAVILLCLSFFPISCEENPQLERLKQYFASINAAETTIPGVNPPPSLVPPSASLPQIGNLSTNQGTGQEHATTGGTPRAVNEGFCGDGIINGDKEDCDLQAIQFTDCRSYNGIAGTVSCLPDCRLNIGDCITPKVDALLGGMTETCRCDCSTTPCRGACSTALAALAGTSECRYICDNQCICQCEGKLQAQIDNCEFRCSCVMDAVGNPQCACNLEQCDILTTISPNIATISSARMAPIAAPIHHP